jgi:large subunit ribosomal protein L1
MAKETKKTAKAGKTKQPESKTKAVKPTVLEIDTTKTYSLNEASEMLPKLSTSRFVGAINVDIVLNLKEKQKKESIRGSVTLPNSMGDDKKVVVICEEKDEKAALAAGADKAGSDKLVEEILNGYSDFDILIATPSQMPKMVKLGKVLGPKGLMPNPKNGTVTTDVEKTVQSFKAGKLNFKSTPDQGVIRMKVAKADMKPEQIKENVVVLLKEVFNESKKYASNPFKKIVISPTMGAGVKLDVNDIMAQI